MVNACSTRDILMMMMMISYIMFIKMQEALLPMIHVLKQLNSIRDDKQFFTTSSPLKAC